MAGLSGPTSDRPGHAPAPCGGRWDRQTLFSVHGSYFYLSLVIFSIFRVWPVPLLALAPINGEAVILDDPLKF
jgi:hypothetical protein